MINDFGSQAYQAPSGSFEILDCFGVSHQPGFTLSFTCQKKKKKNYLAFQLLSSSNIACLPGLSSLCRLHKLQVQDKMVAAFALLCWMKASS